MGKKRKAGGRPFGHERSNHIPEGDSKLRINTYEDVANSEDEFFINQDKILLEEGPAQKKQRKTQEEGKFLLLLQKWFVIKLTLQYREIPRVFG